MNDIIKIILSDNRDYEYHKIDGFLTDNSTVFIEDVPYGKVHEVLQVIYSLLNCYGFLYGSYSDLFEFSYL